MAAGAVHISVCECNTPAAMLCFHLQGSVSDGHDLTRSLYGDVRCLSKNGQRHVVELCTISFCCVPPFVSRINT